MLFCYFSEKTFSDLFFTYVITYVSGLSGPHPDGFVVTGWVTVVVTGGFSAVVVTDGFTVVVVTGGFAVVVVTLGFAVVVVTRGFAVVVVTRGFAVVVVTDGFAVVVVTDGSSVVIGSDVRTAGSDVFTSFVTFVEGAVVCVPDCEPTADVMPALFVRSVMVVMLSFVLLPHAAMTKTSAIAERAVIRHFFTTFFFITYPFFTYFR